MRCKGIAIPLHNIFCKTDGRESQDGGCGWREQRQRVARDGERGDDAQQRHGPEVQAGAASEDGQQREPPAEQRGGRGAELDGSAAERQQKEQRPTAGFGRQQKLDGPALRPAEKARGSDA